MNGLTNLRGPGLANFPSREGYRPCSLTGEIKGIRFRSVQPEVNGTKLMRISLVVVTCDAS